MSLYPLDMDSENSGAFCHQVTQADDGKRLDVFLAECMESLSRSLVAQMVREGIVHVDGKPAKPSLKLKPGQRVHGMAPALKPSALVPQDLELDIVYEDAHLLVLNKAAGMVVHPAPGHPDGTLVNALLHHCPDLGGIGGEARPGIVHRLDKDTSGLMVVAKHQLAHERLVLMFHDRLTEKRYETLVWGEMANESGRLDAPIGRHPVDRKRMAAHAPSGRQALSLWRVKGRYSGVTRLEVEIKTGRTHQIRVHLAHAGHPIVGDELYGLRKVGDRIRDPWMRARLARVTRQMLHARFLAFPHPVGGRAMVFESNLPEDMGNLIRDLAPWQVKGNESCAGSF